VVRIHRSQDLRAHVPDTHCLHNRTHRATGDNARTFRRGLHEHTTGAILANQLMRQRVIDQRDADQILLRRFDSLFDRQGNLARLAGYKTDVATLVTDYYERRKGEVLTTLNDLGDAIDRDHL